jgi:hypothetical protein
MKKLLIVLAILVSGTLFAAPPDVDGKIEKSFKDAFPKAEKVTWYENETTYEVLFMNGQVKCRMWYDKEGNVTKTERYYTEDGLCPYILAKVKAKYAGKKVFGVTEVNSESGIVYHIILEDEKKWYHVNGDSAGYLRLEKKLTKA